MHTPIMLMNNYLDYKYVVTNITELARTHPNKLLQLNEVFLKDRPVNRLNIDMDARVCETCLINSERKDKIMQKWVKDYLQCVLLVLIGNCKKSISVEDCGKLRIYVRNSNKKYSGRLLWYPPTDVKFECGKEFSSLKPRTHLSFRTLITGTCTDKSNSEFELSIRMQTTNMCASSE